MYQYSWSVRFTSDADLLVLNSLGRVRYNKLGSRHQEGGAQVRDMPVSAAGNVNTRWG